MNRAKATPPGQPTIHETLTKGERTKRRREETKNDLERQATQYSRDRQRAYPSIQEQLDIIYHEGLPKWKAQIKKIKDDNPKPTE